MSYDILQLLLMAACFIIGYLLIVIRYNARNNYQLLDELKTTTKRRNQIVNNYRQAKTEIKRLSYIIHEKATKKESDTIFGADTFFDEWYPR